MHLHQERCDSLGRLKLPSFDNNRLAMDNESNKAQFIRRIRVWLALFIVGLVLSGLTAFPLERELRILVSTSGCSQPSEPASALCGWLLRVRDALAVTNERYPFIAYGTDWLAFAHLTIAVAFIGPLRDPIRNKWVITFGLIACAGVIPLALIAGCIRGIPFYWRLIDCSFGVVGAIPLIICRRYVAKLEAAEKLPRPVLQ